MVNIMEQLGLHKVSCRWVPRMLTAPQKHRRVECCTELLQQFEQSPDKFLEQLVTQEETRVHHFDPETKQQSMQWKHADSPTPKKFKAWPSAGKVMVTVFWDCHGINCHAGFP